MPKPNPSIVLMGFGELARRAWDVADLVRSIGRGCQGGPEAPWGHFLRFWWSR